MSKPCPHCGATLNSMNGRHERVCVYAPDITSRLLAFLRANADEGRLMTIRNYTTTATGHNLPGVDVLVRQLGSWDGVADWAGLQRGHRGAKFGNDNAAKPEKRVKRLMNTMPDPIGPDPERSYAEGMPAREGVLVVAAWDVRAKRYVPGRMERGWVMLW